MPHGKRNDHHCPGLKGPVDGYPGSCLPPPAGFYGCMRHENYCVRHDWIYMKSKTCVMCDREEKLGHNLRKRKGDDSDDEEEEDKKQPPKKLTKKEKRAKKFENKEKTKPKEKKPASDGKKNSKEPAKKSKSKTVGPQTCITCFQTYPAVFKPSKLARTLASLSSSQWEQILLQVKVVAN